MRQFLVPSQVPMMHETFCLVLRLLGPVAACKLAAAWHGLRSNRMCGKVTPGQMLRLSRAELSPWLSGMPTQEQAQYFPLNPVHSTMPPPPEVSEH